jgi:hypothetical protein
MALRKVHTSGKNLRIIPSGQAHLRQRMLVAGIAYIALACGPLSEQLRDIAQTGEHAPEHQTHQVFARQFAVDPYT